MSNPTDSPGASGSNPTPLPDAVRAWVQKIFPLLPGIQHATATNAVAPVQAAPPTPAPKPQQRKKKSPDAETTNEAFDRIFTEQDTKKKSGEGDKQPDDPEEQWSYEDAIKEKYKDLPPVFQYPIRRSPILGRNENLRTGDKDYEKLPKDLKSKMTSEVWQAIKPQRSRLISVYLRLREYGAWVAVTKVTGIKEKLPWHGSVGALQFGIYGTGGIAFEQDGKLVGILLGSGHFGKDNPLMAAMHPGQDSYREWRNDEITPAGVLDPAIHEWGRKNPPPSSSLHISIGPGKAFDAHIDRISPVVKPVDGQSVPGTNSSEHIGEEAIRPDNKLPLISRIPLIGKIPKPPGVSVNVSRDNISPIPREERKVTKVLFTFKVEWDWVGGGNTKPRKRVYNPHPQLPAPPDDAEMLKQLQEIESKAKQVSKRFPRTSENDIDAEVLAEVITLKLLDAAKKGERSISVDFPYYINSALSAAEQKAVHDAVMEIGNIVRSVLGSRVAGVNNVTVHIPSTGALNVPIKK